MGKQGGGGGGWGEGGEAVGGREVGWWQGTSPHRSSLLEESSLDGRNEGALKF